jgi:uncharacterized phage protein gp47/JayE
MTTNVPPLQFTPEGLIVPQESAVLAGVQQDIDTAFGGGVNPALETPQGQLASSTSAIIGNNNGAIAELVNQMNPDTATGIYQDALGRIYFIDRSPGAPTAVECDCIGAFGVVIPVGAQAQDTSGNLYQCVDGGIIPVSGTITLTFANILDGPIPCPPNTLTTIYRAVPGWDSINNLAPGVLGRFVETREEFEFRRQNSVAINAKGSKEAIYAAVFDVADVLDVYVTENVLGVPINVGPTNYPLVDHSVYVAVVGGVAQDIGNAIYVKKDLGCNMNGNTTVVVTDESYTPPKPTYNITFNRPTPLPILFEVQLADSASLPSDIEALVKAAIIAAFNGLDGRTQRARIGGVILASKYVGPVSLIGPEVSILTLLIGTVTPTLPSVAVGIDQAPTVTEADITVILVP